MRKKKLLIYALLAAAMMNMNGCAKLSESFDETQAETESQTSSEEGLVTKAENLVRDFITAVNLQNYSGISSMVYMPKNSFVSDNSIQWYILRTSLADVTGVNIKNLDIEISDGALEKDATIYVNKSGYKLHLILDTDNTWKISLNGLYVENWSLKVPKGCSITIDGNNVDDYLIPATVIDNYDTYTFPAVAKQDMNVETTSPIYGKFNQTVTPSADSESVPLICKINDAETTNILRQIQSIWNNLYTDYSNGVEVSSIKKYFADDIDNNVLTDIMTSYFPALEQPDGDHKDNGSYLNFYMKEIIPWTKDNYGSAILKSADSVQVNFGYRLDFTSTTGGVFNLNKVSQITMKYDQANATYKIGQVDDTKLFFNNDYSTNDY